MKISTRGRYALRTMLDLALNSEDSFASLTDISERQNISKKYLEQIISALNRAGMLETARGYNGGYKLLKRAEDYTVADILRVTEGSLAPVSCLDCKPNKCPKADACQTLFVWEGLDKLVNEYFDSITLQDIIDRSKDYSNFVI